MRDVELIERAKTMRRDASPYERKLWLALRARRFENAKFRRQVVIKRYIVDFACRLPTKLIVEVDGETHAHQIDNDERRTLFLEQKGYRILRFTNGEVGANFEGVLMSIQSALPLSPALSPEGEREL